jgi:6-phosphogluconolactonase (cycloisomerase 2 family)
MIRKSRKLAMSGMALFCAAVLVACNCAAVLRYITVAPVSGEVYASASALSGVKAAKGRAARPIQPGGKPRVHAASLSAATASPCTLQYAATGLYSNGTTQDQSSTVTWSSSSTSVAVVSTSGLVTPVSVGATNIGASLNGITATSETLTVDALNTIALVPAPPASIPQGSTFQFTADGNFTFGAGGSGDLDVSAQVTWSTSDPSVATVDPTGNVTAVSPGPATITATSCDSLTSGSVNIVVGQPVPMGLVITSSTLTISTGTTTIFTAMESLTGGGTQAPQNPVTWSSATTGVAGIVSTSGTNADMAVVSGLTAGTSMITANEVVSSLSGSATLTVQAASASFAYIGNLQGTPPGTSNFSGTISSYTVNAAAGTITPLAEIAASSPQQVLLHPSGDFLYYIDTGSAIHMDYVDSTTGALNPSNNPPSVAGSAGGNSGVIDPLGRFIYVIDNTASTIFGYSIGQTNTPSTNGGVLTAINGMAPPSAPTGYTDANLNGPIFITTDRAGKYLYVVNNNTAMIAEYTINPDGTITALATIATGLSPFYGTVDANGHFFVANNGASPQTVSGYTIAANNGQLSHIADTTITGATSVFNVLTDPTGSFLYVLDSPSATAGQVFTFGLTPASGAVGAQIGSAVAVGVSPYGMAIDPTGVLLAVDNNNDSTISYYKVTAGSPTGTQQTVATGNVPYFVTFYTAAAGQ